MRSSSGAFKMGSGAQSSEIVRRVVFMEVRSALCRATPLASGSLPKVRFVSGSVNGVVSEESLKSALQHKFLMPG